jgi:hypothetical protein
MPGVFDPIYLTGMHCRCAEPVGQMPDAIAQAVEPLRPHATLRATVTAPPRHARAPAPVTLELRLHSSAAGARGVGGSGDGGGAGAGGSAAASQQGTRPPGHAEALAEVTRAAAQVREQMSEVRVVPARASSSPVTSQCGELLPGRDQDRRMYMCGRPESGSHCAWWLWQLRYESHDAATYTVPALQGSQKQLSPYQSRDYPCHAFGTATWLTKHDSSISSL